MSVKWGYVAEKAGAAIDGVLDEFAVAAAAVEASVFERGYTYMQRL